MYVKPITTKMTKPITAIQRKTADDDYVVLVRVESVE